MQNVRSSRLPIRWLIRPASKLKRLFRRWEDAGVPQGPDATDAPRVDFRCNACGSSNNVALVALQREQPSCARCGSTVRDRAMVHLLTSSLLGTSAALPDLASHPELTGIGLSDSDAYADALARKFTYANTFFDAKPMLDIANAPAELNARYDFIIASDVFEHIAPPVARGFTNARRLLKAGGVLIFSVPFTFDADTLEHFPELHDFRLIESTDGWRLENRTVDGRDQTFTNLVFHGGSGATLEMRHFSLDALKREFAAAGFSRIHVADEEFLSYGIRWPEPWSVPIVAYA